MTTVIYYHPEAYTTSGLKLMGRNAAGESFRRGFLVHSQASEFCEKSKGIRLHAVLRTPARRGHATAGRDL